MPPGLPGQALQDGGLVVDDVRVAIPLVQLAADLGVGGGVELVADEAGTREHDEEDGADDVGELKAEDLPGRVRGADLGVVADPGQDIESQADREGTGQFAGGCSQRIEESDLLAAALKAEFITDIRGDGPGHDPKSSGEGALDGHGRNKEHEVPLRQEQQQDQADRVEGGGQDQGPVLADPVRKSRREGRAHEACDDVDHQEKAGARRGETPGVGEEEHVKGGHPAWPQGDEQVCRQDPDDVSAAEQLGIVGQCKVAAVVLADGLRGRDHRNQEGDGDHDDHEPADGLDRVDVLCTPLFQQDRDGQGCQRADHAHGGQDAEDPGPLLIALGQDRRPGRVRQAHDGLAQVHREKPDDQVDLRRAFWSVVEHVDGGDQHWGASHHPDLVSPEPGPRSVHAKAYYRIQPDVQRAHQEEGVADDGEAHAELAREVGRKLDADRQSEGGEGQADGGEGHGGGKTEVSVRRRPVDRGHSGLLPHSARYSQGARR